MLSVVRIVKASRGWYESGNIKPVSANSIKAKAHP